MAEGNIQRIKLAVQSGTAKQLKELLEKDLSGIDHQDFVQKYP